MSVNSDIIQRFMNICDYPDLPVPGPHGGEMLVFDDNRVEFIPGGSMLQLRCDLASLPEDPEKNYELLGQLMDFALPRAVRETAVLSQDQDTAALFLWCEFPPPENDSEFLRQVEEFLSSIDWWNSRIAPEKHFAANSGFSSFAMSGMIRP